MSNDGEQLDLAKCAAAAATCACFNFRKASRAITQLFDELLQPTGLRSTQLVILLAVAVHESQSSARLARELVMDRSTLVRNLKPLEKRGLVTVGAGADRRSRAVELTDEGREALAAAIPYWEQAQARFVEHIGADRWQRLMGELATAVDATRAVPGTPSATA